MKKATFITIIVLSIVTISLFGATKDTTPPTVSITSPKDTAVVSGVVTIKVDASDSGGIAKVEFYVGDSKLGEDSSKPYEYSWDTKKMKDGTYVLTAKAIDSAGNKNSASIKVVVNNTKVEIWQRIYPEAKETRANYVQQTKDGGYIIAGRTSYFGIGNDMFILKVNSKGQVEWEKSFGGEDTRDMNYIFESMGNQLLKQIIGEYTQDLNLALSLIEELGGQGVSNENNFKDFESVSNYIGELIWQEVFGMTGIDDSMSILGLLTGQLDLKNIRKASSEANFIQQTADGGYIVTGWRTYFSFGGFGGKDICVLKLNSKGKLEWQKAFGGEKDDVPYFIYQTKDGGYTVVGYTYSFESVNKNVYILKLNSNGNLEWQKTFGGRDYSKMNAIYQTKDDGYILAGWIDSVGSGGKDMHILKLSSKGDLEWQKVLGGQGDDIANSVQQTADGGYIVAGLTNSFGSGKQDIYIVKLNSKGDVAWQKTFGGKDDDAVSSTQSLKQTTDGGYIVAGWTKSSGSGGEDIYVLKLSSNGEAEWQKTFGGKNNDGVNSIQQTADGGYIIAGWTDSPESRTVCTYVLKLNSKGEVGPLDTVPPDVKIISPSEGKVLGGTTEISIDAKDNHDLEKVTLYIDGKKIKEYASGPYTYTWDSSKASEGAHMITVEAVDKSENVTRKSVMAITDKVKDILWKKTFGGGDDDVANSIQQTKDGGYIVAGWTKSLYSGWQDAYILKFNSKGGVEWQKTFGGEKDDVANSVQQTTDGGYIVAGWTYTPGSAWQDVYVLKLNSKGDLEWQKTLGGGDHDVANSIQQTKDGGYVVAGWTKSSGSGWEDVYILKLNSKGAVEWQKTFGGKGYDVANSVQQTMDGGFIIAGVTKSIGFGAEDMYILKLNSKGDLEWQKTFGGKNNDGANSIQQTTDGRYIVAGWTKSFGSGGEDVYILKLNSKGGVEWQKTFGGKYSDGAKSIQQTTDGGYIVAGWTNSFSSGYYTDVYILKLNAKGDLEWQKTFDSAYEANSIQQTTDGGYVFAGWTVSLGSADKDAFVLKLDSKGEADTIPPEIKIVSPSDGVELGGTIDINIDAKDNYDLEKVTLYIDGKKVKEYTSSPYKYTWDSSKATEGAHTITAEAVDKSGNVRTKSVMVIMDKTKDVSWQKTFGGEKDDGANSIQQTTDGGYIVAGWTKSFGSGGEDVYILKSNAKGDLEWQKTFGGKGDDEANSIQQTSDGGYIVAGWTESFGSGKEDVYILKLNSKGEVEWQKTFGGEEDDEANSIQQTSDGGYIVAGWTESFGSGYEDVYILKLNAKGEIEWQKTFGERNNFGDSNVDEANSIQQTTDGGYIVAGCTWPFGPRWWEDIYILKLNTKGEVEWQKTFGGGSNDGANSIQQTMDGGYIVAGWTESFGFGYEDVYILKLNSEGEVEWQKTFDGMKDDEANSIQQTMDGGYIVAGWTKSFGSGYYEDENVYILKLNAKAEVEWQKTFDGKEDDEANSIQQTTDGAYIVAGWTKSFGSGKEDVYILKLNSKGEIDTTPPVVKIISPKDGVELGGTIEINIDAKDNYDLEKVTLYIDGKKVKEYTSGPYKYSWDSSKATEGAHAITAEAIDWSGNVGRKSITTAIVDRIKDVSWQKTFGGENDDVANSIQQTADGGYIIAGWTKSFGSGGKDVYTLKLNSKGEVEWQKTFGGWNDDEANSIQQTTDGGYIVAGSTYSFGSGEYDVYILKLNSKGEVEWQKTFGGENDDVANSIQQTADGGYIIAGVTKFIGFGTEDTYILKLNSKGEVEWQKTFGGERDDGANSIQQTIDDGYIVAGWTSSFGSRGYDVYILKLNSKGKAEWEKTFGGEYSDEANSIQQTNDGGYIVAGYSFGDVYILKLNSKGDLEWQKTFDSGYVANSTQQTTDGGYIVAGYKGKDVYVLKLNSKGESEWQKTFGGKDDDEANSIQQTKDGGYIVAGWTVFPDSGKDVYVLKLDSKGELDTIPPEVKIISPSDGVELGGTIEINIDATDNVELEKVTLYIDGKKVKEYTSGPYKYSWDSSKASEGTHTITAEAVDKSGNVRTKSGTVVMDMIKDVSWQKTFGGKLYYDVANSVQQTMDGGYIIAGVTKSSGFGTEDMYILKLNSKGDLEWQKTFGGKDDDVANSIQQTADGGYIACGWTKSFGFGGQDAYILKFDSKGEVESQKTFGGEKDDEANSIQQTTDGGYIAAGWTKSFGSGGEDVYILKLNSTGEIEWQKTFGGKADDEANSIQQTKDGGYIVAGWTDSFGSGYEDVYILKLNSKGEVEWQKMFGGRKDDVANSIQQTMDGGYIVAGWTKSFGSGYGDVYILKLDSKGDLEWEKTFDSGYVANSIQQTTDGGYIVAGYSGDIYILKLDSKGEVEE